MSVLPSLPLSPCHSCSLLWIHSEPSPASLPEPAPVNPHQTHPLIAGWASARAQQPFVPALLLPALAHGNPLAPPFPKAQEQFGTSGARPHKGHPCHTTRAVPGTTARCHCHLLVPLCSGFRRSRQPPVKSWPCDHNNPFILFVLTCNTPASAGEKVKQTGPAVQGRQANGVRGRGRQNAVGSWHLRAVS